MTTTDVAAARGTRLIPANGIDIACTDVGDGPPLVLLHGALTSTGPKWAGSGVAHVDHFAQLARHFRVIAPDTRGCGATVHAGPASFEDLVDDVVALIESLDLQQPHITGFSEGGVTATLVALRHPDLVGALVNHAGFDHFDPQAPAHQSLGAIFGGGPDATRADPDAAERTFRSMGPPMSDTFARMQADYDEAQGTGHWRTYLGQFFDRAAAPVPYSVEDLAALEVPTLILTGDRDIFCSVEAACTTYRTIPECELGIVPGTGHEVNAGIIDLTIDFLERRSG
jgi:pimeloyl-ACP methyl ester carboxylesterase